MASEKREFGVRVLFTEFAGSISMYVYTLLG